MLVFPKEKQGFLKTSLLEVNIDFGSILMPTWSHFAPQDRPKSSRKSIPRGIVFLIDFGIDFLCGRGRGKPLPRGLKPEGLKEEGLKTDTPR